MHSGAEDPDLVGTSIPDFDVEPAAGARFWAVLLGVLGAVVGVLAVIGWPLPVGGGRYGVDEAAWAQTVHGVQAWLAHDGWRVSGSSWVFGAAAVAALSGVGVLLHPSWSERRRFVLVVVPAGVLLVAGPAVQWAFGLPWSNYGVGSAAGIALGIVAVAALAGVGAAVVAVLRRRHRPHDGRDRRT
ncbi:hypothetical protein [Curtobacterium luteum]|uniref:Uncharacterized protein n=1 Tax=Curtobacterium luteum TaxID=33881 RepID=A0A175RZA4_9MICO|nr:hypothetical protein [Curtobacterium luteum]KTR08834.1 hypothetical protein NS184_04755 [Curtobacterium luteum]